MTLRDAVAGLAFAAALPLASPITFAQTGPPPAEPRVDAANRLFIRFVEDAAVVPSFWAEGQAAYLGNQAAFLPDAPGASQADLLRVGPVFALNVAEDFEFGARVAVAHRDPDVGDAETGLTDLDLWGKVAIVSDPLTVTLGLMLTLPTGSEDKLLGTGETNVELFAAARKDFRSLTLTGHAGLRVNQDPDFPDISIEGKNSVLLGVAALFPVGRSVVLAAEWAFETEPVEGRKNGSLLLGGLEYRLREGLAVRGAGGGGLSDGAPDTVLTGSIVWLF